MAVCEDVRRLLAAKPAKQGKDLAGGFGWTFLVGKSGKRGIFPGCKQNLLT